MPHGFSFTITGHKYVSTVMPLPTAASPDHVAFVALVLVVVAFLIAFLQMLYEYLTWPLRDHVQRRNWPMTQVYKTWVEFSKLASQAKLIGILILS